MGQPEKLYELLDAVNSKEAFLRFLQALVEDRRDSVEQERVSPSFVWGPDANGWENTTVEGFLEAMYSWSEDRKIEEQPSWQLFAEMLMSGKIYE